MRFIRLRLCNGVLIVVGTLSLCPTAAQWPHWRGPGFDGTVSRVGVFEAERLVLDVAWNREAGPAYSGISVMDGRLVTTFSDGALDWLMALDAASGVEIWRYEIGPTFRGPHESKNGPRSTPSIDGGVVYGLGGGGRLFATRLQDGAEIWSLDLVERLGARRPFYGFATSPLVVGDVLFVQVGGPEGHSLVGFDKKTGLVLWSRGDDRVGYQSPILAKLAGQEQILAVTNRHVFGLTPRTGVVLWSSPIKTPGTNGYATPVLVGDNQFVLTSPPGCAAYQLTATERGYELEKLWQSRSLKRSFCAPVLHDGHLYGFEGGYLTCVDAANGGRVWKSRSPGGHGLILVDGHLVIFAKDGAVVIAEASPVGYEEKARIQAALRGGRTGPSFAAGTVFVRNTHEVAAVVVRTGAP